MSTPVAMRDRIVDFKRVKASTLIPHSQNWRLHPEAQRSTLRAALDEIGIIDAIIARETPDGLQVIDGHLRADVDPDAEWPVLVVDLDDDEAKKALATFDPLSAMAGADSGMFLELQRQVEEDCGQQIRSLMADVANAIKVEQGKQPREIVEDKVPEPPAEPVTRPGDIWLLGDHRLMCGDSTCVEDVARLMHGERAGLMNTDPPYGVGYANEERPNPGVAKPRVANDSLCDESLQSFLEEAFRAATHSALYQNAAWYLWHAHLTQGYFAAAAAAAAANVVLHRQIIWVKPVLLLGRGQYHWKHEPCFMGWVKGSRPPDYGLGDGERTQTTVWEIASVKHSERKEFNHSTPKPVGLFSIPILKHLRVGELCYEPFAGSGPQVIAAEQLQRRCCAMELEPAYCDVIVSRWEKLTGRKAELVSSGSDP